MIENTFDRARGDTRFNPRHGFFTNLLWEIPVGASKGRWSGGRRANRVLGGWQLSVVYIGQTGEYLTPTFGGIADRQRNRNLPRRERSIDRWLDATAFTAPPSGRFGNSGCAIILGPGRHTLNLGVFKSFSMTECSRFRLEVTTTDALSHPNLDVSNSNIFALASVETIRTIQARDFADSRVVVLGGRIES